MIYLMFCVANVLKIRCEFVVSHFVAPHFAVPHFVVPHFVVPSVWWMVMTSI